MNFSMGVAIYFIIWWLVLFAVLPIGVRDQQESGAIVPGTPGSAPSHPQLGKKALLTTTVSAVVFALVYAVVTYGGIVF